MICNHWAVQLEPMLQNKARKTGQGGGSGSISLSNPLSIWCRTMAVALVLNLPSLGRHVFQRVTMLHPDSLLFLNRQ